MVEDLNADSLDMIEITMALEEHFCLAVPDAKVEQIKTVADIYDFVADVREKAKLGLPDNSVTAR
jgi:acyl carrier protein